MESHDITASILLIYGAFLVWGGITAIKVFTGLVQPIRPAHFVALHLTSIWTVGAVSMLIGIAILYRGLSLYA
jgi:hypothetical protein